MKKDFLEDLWGFMRGFGHYQEYADYQDYREKKFGIKKEPTISELAKNVELEDLEEFAEKLPPKKKEKFENTLTGKEREDYLELFGESED